jgi:hypothetical protein
MWWPWRQACHAREQAEVQRVQAQAEADLQLAQARWPEVREVVSRLREHREQNRFSALIEEAMRRRA